MADLESKREMNSSNTSCNLEIYCTRPGARMWKASIADGRVINTLHYKQMLSASYKLEPASSQEFRHKLEGITKQKSVKQKTITHNFSLLHCKKIKCFGSSIENILLTYNSIGIYLISITDMTNINFIRLAKNGSSISNIVIDSERERECEGYMEDMQPGNGENVYSDLVTNEMEPFTVYVTTCNGFVERHIIRPHMSLNQAQTCRPTNSYTHNTSCNLRLNSNASTTFVIFANDKYAPSSA